MGLTADEFWDMTPRCFAALWKAYIASEERTNQRVNALRFSLYHASGAKKENGQPFKPEDFGLETLKSVAKADRPTHGGMTTEEQIAMAEAITSTYKGRMRKHRGA